MVYGKVEFGPMLAEGKTKIIYAHPENEDVVYMVHKDWISAGDGVRRNELPGKGKLSCRTNSNIFYLLEDQDIPTHYIGMVGDDINIVTACEMVPLEVIMRRIATGHFIVRNPDVAEGTRFEPVYVEFTLKDDEAHDPLISDEEIAARGIATADEVRYMKDAAREVFAVLEEAWAAQDVTLVDCKIEFGRDAAGDLLVADVIDNDSWRIWPGGDKNRMLDKQVYRNMPEVTDEKLRALMAKYETVANMTDAFVED